MPLTINTNMAASKASYYLSKNNDMLQKSLDRLSSGKKITSASDDAGGLAVSMKLEGSIDRLKGASNNVSNAISFLQVQDGLLESAANIVSRMGELKGLSEDVLKSSSDQATYDSEFSDLQGQLYQLSQTKFNGVELFDPSNDSTFQDASGVLQADVKSVVVSEDGTTTVDIHQSSLLAGVTLVVAVASNAITGIDSKAQAWSDANTATNAAGVDAWLAAAADGDHVFSLAVNSGAKLQLQDLTSEAFTVALENLATLRATNGGQVSRLQYAQENLQSQTTNLQAAVGRIVDVDIATETAELAKQQILVQAAASMTSQANMANEVALMLLR